MESRNVHVYSNMYHLMFTCMHIYIYQVTIIIIIGCEQRQAKFFYLAIVYSVEEFLPVGEFKTW